MGTKKSQAVILTILLFVLFVLIAACSANTAEHETALTDLQVQVSESPEPKELNPSDLLAVHFIDVGEGDSILIVQGEYAMLVDGGSAEMGTTVFSYLRGQGITALEYVVATHSFADHIGGLPDVLRRISVKNVLLPMVYHDTSAYNTFLTAVEGSGAEVAVPYAGHSFTLGDAVIGVLSPSPDDEWENKANYSIVLRVEFGSTSFLLMGDAMREVEAGLLDSTARLSSDVLKVARHGAMSATTNGFLDAVSPSIAVISAGENNSFLSQEVLRRLNSADVHVFRTDENGGIVITSDGTMLGVAVDR
ncbi:MAG: MBL fold metallo-hydrolase [Defluviitaleaceae bacterium]|nr:MBL fold metallo-hydrolase [Defluviitaleaceae bacterium]